MKFRLLVGAHVSGRGESRVVHKQGSVIETDFDLSKLNSRNPAAAKKFGRIFDDGSTDFDGSHMAPPDPFKQKKGESAEDYAKRMSDLAEQYAQRAQDALERDNNLESLTVAQLREIASSKGLDVSEVFIKEDLVMAIRGTES